MEKINFANGVAPYINANNLNLLQNNVEDAIEDAAEDALNFKIITTPGTSCDDYVNIGIYYFETANAPSGLPEGTAGWLQVIKSSSEASIKQIYHRISNNDVYIRTKYNGTWINWIKVLNENSYSASSGKFKLGSLLIQWGTIENVTVPATSYGDYNVTFPEAFGSAPYLFAQGIGNYNIVAQVGSSTNTTTGYFKVRSVDGYERTNRSFNWLAIGLASS